MASTKRRRGGPGKVSDKQRRISEKSLANLKPWPPGVSGNLAGRPPGRTLSEAYREMLGQPMPRDLKSAVERAIDEGKPIADIIALVMASHIIKGVIPAAIEMRKATEGDKVQQEQRMQVFVADIEAIRRHRWELAQPALAAAGQGDTAEDDEE